MFRQRPYRHVVFGLTARNDVRIASTGSNSAALSLSVAANRLYRAIVAHESFVVASQVRLAALFLVLRRVSFQIGAQMARPRDQAATEPSSLGVVAGQSRFDIAARRDECINETLSVEGRFGYSRDHMGPSDESRIA
jgi:hypothetical protein